LTVLDTTYLLPLAKIQVDKDLLLAIAEKKSELRFDEISLSLISLFELQAKAAKMKIPSDHVNRAIEVILDYFRILTFTEPKIVELSLELKPLIPDYVDSLIVATASSIREHLVTEDSLIWEKRKLLKDKYHVEVDRFQDIVRA
jgi:predicted nucleic acid-binding protein